MIYTLQTNRLVRSAGLTAFLIMLVVTSLLAQDRVVTGKVTDETGNGMPGVSIVLKGTSTGTTSDTDGVYSVSIPSGYTNPVLVFSFIGYKSIEESVGERTTINMPMEASLEELSEVVVVGYGTQSKTTVTGSVASVEGKELVKVRTPNVLNSMTGQIPGVFINTRSGEPGKENPSVFIRGKSTTGNAEPLYIIDGVQRYELPRLNPNDIETMNVLKDASAAIYGARAANGVILVTTKRGKVSKPTFDFSYNAGFSQPTRNPKMADSYTFAQVYNENIINPLLDAGQAPTSPALFTDEQLQKFKEGKEYGYQTVNWYEEMTKTVTPLHQFSLSATGGTDKIGYYLSVGQLTQHGHFEEGSTKLERYNFRSNIDVKLNDYLKVGLDLSGRMEDRTYPGRAAIQTDSRGVQTVVPDTRGVYSHTWLYRPYWTKYWPGTNYLTPNRDSENIMNWVSDNSGSMTEDYKAIETRLHFELDIPGVEGLSLRGSANYDIASLRRKIWSLPTYVYTRTEPTPGDYVYTQVKSGSSAALAALTEYQEERAQPTLNWQINYEKSFGQHNVTAMAGYEQMRIDNSYFQASRTDFPTVVLDQLDAGSLDKNRQANNGSGGITSRQNYFSRFTYDYNRKYLAQLIFRYDGSPQFPEFKQWGFFPGVMLGWRMSEESFMDNVAIIDELKLRASYGEMGNDNVLPFQYIPAFRYGNNYVVGNSDVIGLTSAGAANPNITWEVAKTTNVGFDLSLWNGGLSVQFDYFKTTRSNILTPRTVVVPDYVGIPILPDENYGEVENKGFELSLNHTRTVNKLTYSIGGNISYAKNQVIVGNEPPAAESYQAVKGKPVGARLVYRAIGIFSSAEEVNNYPHLQGAKAGDIIYEDVNGDNVLNSRDQVRLDETSMPQLVYAINASVQYANFDFTILFQGQEKAISNFYETLDYLQDKNFYFPIMNPNSLGNFLQWRADDRWSYDNTDATQPRADANNATNNSTATNASTHWIFDAGFLRLKNVELGYTLPAAISQKIKLQSLRVYVNGNNLLLLKDNMKELGFDPETTDYWYYPNQRTFNIGASLTF
ncbi:MAG TPA: TonB-dependent receptor [Ohtaekwangia sp.]